MTPRAPIQRLLSVGSILADIRIEVPSLPPRGGDVLGSSATVMAGGGFNILAAASRQGLPALFAGLHGTGPYGTRIREELAREGIATLLPPSPEADSGFCIVLVEPDGERTFVTSPGIEASLGERALSDIQLTESDAVFVSGYDLCYPQLGPAIGAWIGRLPLAVWLIVDPGPLAAEIPPAIINAAMSRASIWTMNRREAALLGGTTDLSELQRRIRPRLPPDALLIIRDGAAGVHFCFDGCATFHTIPAPRVAMVDSTGAGDAHTGVLIAAFAHKIDPLWAVPRANAAAALSVTRPGSATAPNREELDRFLAELDRKARRHEAEA
ncbi:MULTISPECIES: PfkB family carbohydrate kinase [unclassified Acidisoma]|uniref:PfkB family carbohydrate kinase n=1 Tax=unclassified Acidisoma TaxID=2634065 RepID=UPI001C204978|nr:MULTISPECIES: PfkB family carbohydrate kinase [unclassified Acidisoma]